MQVFSCLGTYICTKYQTDCVNVSKHVLNTCINVLKHVCLCFETRVLTFRNSNVNVAKHFNKGNKSKV